MKEKDIYEGGVSIEWKFDQDKMNYEERPSSEIDDIRRRANQELTGGVDPKYSKYIPETNSYDYIGPKDIANLINDIPYLAESPNIPEPKEAVLVR
ncbi:MAG: hypothetical protein NUV73_01015 [Candidatus Daviesbacteria bacterium]|nr:hypothetical protein [Candidatus Daviesbacteria bacterium]